MAGSDPVAILSDDGGRFMGTWGICTNTQSHSPWRSAEAHESAEERAEALLLAYLTPAQRESYRMAGVIDVPGHMVWRRIVTRLQVDRISRTIGVVGIRSTDEKVILRYCVRPVYTPGPGSFPLPLADRVLTLLVWLTADPGSFHRIAGAMPV